MAKKPSVKDTIEVPVSLIKLLLAEPEDYKDPTQYEDVQVVAKEMLRVLSKAIVWGS